MLACFRLTWAHVPIAGLLLDVAGAVVLGLAFATKRPEAIRLEVPPVIPTTFEITAPNQIGASAEFPQGLAHSMIRQRAEARLGLFLLVSGFVAQGVGPMFNLGSLTRIGHQWTVLPLAVAFWMLVYLIGWRWYVPRDEARTRRRMQEFEAAALAEREPA